VLETNFKALYSLFRLNCHKQTFKKTTTKSDSMNTTESHCAELIYLLNKPTVSAFARYLKLSVPNASYKINCLVKKGYVVRERSKKDLREQHLCVTNKFLNYYGLNDNAIALLMKRIRETFSLNDVERLVNITQRIIILIDNQSISLLPA